MKNYLICSCFLAFGIDFTTTESAQYMSRFTFALVTPSQNVNTITWGRIQNHVFIAYSMQLFQPAKEIGSGSSLEGYTSNWSIKSNIITSNFTIENVTLEQHNAVWFSQITTSTNPDNPTEKQYYLEVFALPEAPKCSVGSILQDINIPIHCVTNNVFPGAICTFFIINNNTRYFGNISEVISYEINNSSNSGLKKTNCTFTFKAGKFGPGSYTFYVEMYPNITSALTLGMIVRSQTTEPVLIDSPKAVLGANCEVNNYVKENETSYCTCYNNNTSLVPSTIMWTNRIKNDMNYSLHETLTFRTFRNSIFQCTIYNALNWTDTIVFIPKISFPPDEILVNFTNQEFDQCKDKIITISGICFVSECEPTPSVFVNINNLFTRTTTFGNKGEYIFNSSLKSTGVFNISCLANSTEYWSNESKMKITITIKGPPEVPKISKLVKDQPSSSENSRLAIIMCESKGGFPYSKTLYLTCDNIETDATDSDVVIMYLNESSNPTQIICTCIVRHQSNCFLNKTSEIISLHIRSESSLAQVNTAAVGVGVSLAIVIILLIIIMTIVIKRKKDNRNEIVKTNKRQDYNDIQASTQYVNTEMHAYETANVTKPSCSNEQVSSLDRREMPKSRGVKEEHPYDEVT